MAETSRRKLLAVMRALELLVSQGVERLRLVFDTAAAQFWKDSGLKHCQTQIKSAPLALVPQPDLQQPNSAGCFEADPPLPHVAKPHNESF